MDYQQYIVRDPKVCGGLLGSRPNPLKDDADAICRDRGRCEIRFNTSLDGTHKFLSQTNPSSLVPTVRLCQVLLGLWRND